MDFDINTFIRQLSISIVPFLMAITVHEASHGYAAYFLGDDTAKRAGRLTFNPIAHIDIFGLIFLLVTRLFGWAKPVPVNFYNLKHKYGMAIVAIAGPASNMLLALISALILYFIKGIEIYQGSFSAKIIEPIFYMLVFSVQINVALAVFNLLPILPLDGGRIVHNFLPPSKAISFAKTERYGMFIILFLIITNVTNIVILPIIRTITSILI
jgi:Zn-dependent protease